MTSGDTIFEHMTLAELEKWAIQTAMDRNKGIVLAVAKELAVGKNTIYRKLAKYKRQKRSKRSA